MWWLKNVSLISLLIPTAIGLQADEQIRIQDRAENPPEPSQDFIKNLSKGRKTLILGETELPRSWTNYLSKNKHQYEQRSDLETLVLNGAYNFDSIIVNNASSLPRRYLNRLVKFYDTRWSLPAAYDERRIIDTRGLRLPPSLLIVGQTPPASFLYDFGFKVNSNDDNESGEATAFKLSANVMDRASKITNNTLAPVVSSPMAQPIIAWDESHWTGGIVQGDFSWSRALIFPDAFDICGDLAEDGCDEILDWVFHRTKIVSWANLQHRRIKSGQEFDEYDGTPRQGPYTETEFTEIEFETANTYRIQDEMLVSCDIYKLKGDGLTEPFHWLAPDQIENSNYYGSFEMMVPYWRKPLVVFDGVERFVEAHNTTSGMTSESYLLQAIQKYGSDERLKLKEGNSIMAHFKVPHQHGVYKFFIRPIKADLNTPIWLETLLPMRTYLHDDEEPHGIWSAFPFYLSIGIMAIMPMYVLQESF